MSSKADLDKVFSDSVLIALGDVRCTPIKPQYLTSDRTIVVKNFDQFIMQHTAEEIKANINMSNNSEKTAQKVFKFPSGRTFKFECKTSCMASKCMEDGVALFNLWIGPRFLAIEENNLVSYCFRCYSINELTTLYCMSN